MTLCASLTLGGCGKEDDEEESGEGSSAVTFDEDGFVTNGVGKLRIAMVGTGKTANDSGLRLAQEPTDPNAKYYSNEYTLGGQPDDLTVYVTKMTLVRDNPEEDQEKEVPIFSNEDGKPLRITGRTVDMSNFFTEIKCYGADGTILDEECPCGVDTNGDIIEKVAYEREDGTTGETCPSGDSDVEVEQNPVSFVNVSQTGTFQTLKVQYKRQASVAGCVEGYVEQEGYSADTPTENVAWERYCTVKGKGSAEAASGSGSSSSAYLDTTFTAEAELSNFFITAQEQENGEYPIKGGITIEDSGDGPQITMVIDTSSMLRFFKDDNAGDRTMPEFSDLLSGSFFYVRQFKAQNFVFVGEPGAVRGYSVVSNLVEGEEPSGSASNPAAYDECSGDLANCAARAKGRLSVIYDSDDNPMLFNINFTQGSGIDAVNQSKEGIDPSVITSDSSLSGTYKFNQTSTDATDTTTDTNIYQINLDADVGASFDAYGSQKYTGTNNGWFWGHLQMTREF
jgi:hypothetical protein